MLAKLADELPEGGRYLYEPKWDGFRAIVFRGEDDVLIQSRDLRPLDRYFPELHDTLLSGLPANCVVDGEIVIATRKGLDFDALQLRLHPAASRVAKLAQETPSSFVGFDLLAVEPPRERTERRVIEPVRPEEEGRRQLRLGQRVVIDQLHAHSALAPTAMSSGTGSTASAASALSGKACAVMYFDGKSDGASGWSRSNSARPSATSSGSDADSRRVMTSPHWRALAVIPTCVVWATGRQ